MSFFISNIVLFMECVSRYSNGIIISLGRLDHRVFLEGDTSGSIEPTRP